jgi:hypothetical protein
MERTVTVRYSVDYVVDVTFDDDTTCLADAVADIDIPENDSKYVGDSFDPVAAMEDDEDVSEELE